MMIPGAERASLSLGFILLVFTLMLSACSAGTPSPVGVNTLPVTESLSQTSELHSPEPPTPTQEPDKEGAEAMPLTLTSSAFLHEQPIPVKYSCDGDDISPPLAWGEPPEGAQSFALIADDPDAPVGTWVHWVLYDIPADKRALQEAIPPEPELQDGSRHGENSWGRWDYGGPCPPSGTHRYFFKLYALDRLVGLEVGATKADLLEAMEGHILAQAELMGTYTR
jgi:hypothetical protein